MAPKKINTVAKKPAASTKKSVKAPTPTLQMKSLNITRKPKILQLNKLLQKYSTISTSIKRNLPIGRF
jgi:hypothetical protein